jgi:hypothetical protein
MAGLGKTDTGHTPNKSATIVNRRQAAKTKIACGKDATVDPYVVAYNVGCGTIGEISAERSRRMSYLVKFD